MLILGQLIKNILHIGACLGEEVSFYEQFNPNVVYWFEPNPKSGKLVIFPSWLCHYVYPNKSKTQRISIAFNTQFEKR